MVIEIERYVKFITENNLTQRQFLFLYLQYFKRFDLMKTYLAVFPVDNRPNKFLSEGELYDIIEKGLIIKVGDGASANNYEIGLNFKKMFVDKHIAVEELMNTYPAFIRDSKGATLSLTLIDRYELMDLYCNRIGYEVGEHEEVLNDIRYGIENKLIKGKIETFVRSENWKAIRKIRNNDTLTIVEDDL